MKAKLEREIDRLPRLIDAATQQRVVLHPDPRAYWALADIAQRWDLVRMMVKRVDRPSGAAAGEIGALDERAWSVAVDRPDVSQTLRKRDRAAGRYINLPIGSIHRLSTRAGSRPCALRCESAARTLRTVSNGVGSGPAS